MSDNFQQQVGDFIESVNKLIGFRPDLKLSGYSVAEAVHLNIDPAMDAIVRTELQLNGQMAVDLRELVSASPPVDADNLFITFQAGSANYQGEDTTSLGIHMTRLKLNAEILSVFTAGIFVPGASVSDAYQLFVFLKNSGGVSLAKTGVIIGLDPEGRLVAYLTIQVQPGLASVQLNQPSRMAGADPKVMLYVCLALSAFLAVNQGEAPLRWLDDCMGLIG
jgi:hypothetical protein